MTLSIQNSTIEELSTIFEFYDHAIEHQKKVSKMHWKGFDVELVKKEIAEKRQYNITVDGKIACIFAVTFSDPQIWLARNENPSIYIHRIVTHPDFRGYGFVQHIANWAIEFAKSNNLQYVRMDTWAGNEKLVAYYGSFGFANAGTIAVQPNSGLPKHYEGITLQLFEIKV